MKEILHVKGSFLCRWRPKVCQMIGTQFDENNNEEQSIMIDCAECAWNPNNTLRY